jgi:hypothetical protein
MDYSKGRATVCGKALSMEISNEIATAWSMELEMAFVKAIDSVPRKDFRTLPDGVMTTVPWPIGAANWQRLVVDTTSVPHSIADKFPNP